MSGMNEQSIFYTLTGEGWRPDGQGFVGGGFAIDAHKSHETTEPIIHVTQENNAVDEVTFILPRYCETLTDAGYNAQVCGSRVIIVGDQGTQVERYGGYIPKTV
jgi:hypothetical protein